MTAHENDSVAGFSCWQDAANGARVCFAGRPLNGTSGERPADLAALTPPGRRPSWLRQVHSATVVEAVPGESGEGDALVSSSDEMALSIVTADCVPVLIAGSGQIAAVHAGWRGIAGRIVDATLKNFSEPSVAWIGPAIGACCYEVGGDVADRVVEALPEPADVLQPGGRGRPHLDLRQAVELQLRAGGVQDIRHLGPCTRCHEASLWSYRRDGRAAGRNYALIWKEDSISS